MVLPQVQGEEAGYHHTAGPGRQDRWPALALCVTSPSPFASPEHAPSQVEGIMGDWWPGKLPGSQWPWWLLQSHSQKVYSRTKASVTQYKNHSVNPQVTCGLLLTYSLRIADIMWSANIQDRVFMYSGFCFINSVLNIWDYTLWYCKPLGEALRLSKCGM